MKKLTRLLSFLFLTMFVATPLEKTMKFSLFNQKKTHFVYIPDLKKDVIELHKINPGIKEATFTAEIIRGETTQTAIKTEGDKYLTYREGDGCIMPNAPLIGEKELFTIKFLNENEIAIQASNGHYITCGYGPENGNMFVDSDKIIENTIFNLVITG